VNHGSRHNTLKAILLAACSLAACQAAALDAGPRQHIRVVGSSTAYPIITAAAEHFSRHAGGRHAPVVESTGTGGGFKLFCVGLGLHTPDMVVASRAMLPTERTACTTQGVTGVRELKIGYDGIVIANARGAPRFALSTDDLYLALAKEVPDPVRRTRLIANPYRHWHELNPALPHLPIRVYGPPPTSGTRDVLLERVLEQTCAKVPALLASYPDDPEEFKLHCQRLREDGAYINAGENDTRLVRRLIDDPDALGILGFNFLERNPAQLQAATIDGAPPTLDLIERGAYPLSRPLYLYVKEQHLGVVPDLAPFLDHLQARPTSGPDGYLLDYGLIPLRAAEHTP
jgi:phosphate transport system substrate-binding protein